MPIFPKTTPETARVPVTVKPSGLSCKLEVWLTPDNGVTKSASSGLIVFTSTGASQIISATLTTPTAPLSYKVFIDIYADSVLIGAYVATSLATIPEVIITEPGWV